MEHVNAEILRAIADGDKHDTYALKSNLVHLDFQSAEIHAKALVEVSKGWWK